MSELYDISTYNGKDIWDVISNIENYDEFDIKQHNDYIIVKYVKEKLSWNNYGTLGLWRSIILNKKQERLFLFHLLNQYPG